MKVITTRVEDKVYSDLMLLKKMEHVEQAEIVRRLLALAIKEEKMKVALEQLREHKITYRKAAEFVGVPYTELLQAVEGAGIEIGYFLQDLQADTEKIAMGKV